MINTNSAKPPHLYLCTDNNGQKRMTLLDEDDLSILDNGEFSNIDMIINPWKHDKSKDFNVKGYLHTLWATQAASLDFEGKYADFELVNDLRDPAATDHPTDEDDGELPF